MTVDVDTPYELRSKLRPAIKAINDHLEGSCDKLPITSLDDIKGKVLVYCESGSERSPILVAAYLMVVYGLQATTAMQMIQAHRFCLSPEDSMKEMLFDLEVYLRAEREVAEANDNEVEGSSLSAAAGASRKRDVDEGVIFHERPGIAPFTDVVE